MKDLRGGRGSKIAGRESGLGLHDKMGRAMDLMALLEQALMVTEAWQELSPRQRSGPMRECPTPADLEAYARGALVPGRAEGLLDHLAACGHCRQEMRVLIRRLGLAGLPVDLTQLRRDLEQQHPDASAALARLAQTINVLLREEPPVWPDTLRVELNPRGADGLPSGRWACFGLRRPPYIDQGKQLRLDLAGQTEAPPGCWLRLILRQGSQGWDLGSAPLGLQERGLSWDLADLPILSGYLDWTCLHLSAEQRAISGDCVQLGDSLAVETPGQAISLSATHLFDLRPVRSRDSQE